MDKIKAFFSGKKVYLLMALGALAAIYQYMTGVSLGMDGLPVATDIGSLIQELYVFAIGAAAKAAVAKTAG